MKIPWCLLSFFANLVIAYHDVDNVRYDCWPLDASNGEDDIDCEGLGLRWEAPLDQLHTSDKFNVTYWLEIIDSENVFGSSVIFPNKDSNESEILCYDTSACPADPAIANVDNCCVWHANIHTCHPSLEGVCGPWVGQGELATHTDTLVGTIDKSFMAQDIQLTVEGTNFIIAHLKVGNIQITIGKQVDIVGEGSNLLGPILGFCFGALLLVLVMSALLTYVCWRWRRGKVKLKRIRTETLSRKEENVENMYFQTSSWKEVHVHNKTLKVSKSLLVSSCDLELGKTVGQGEFGIVYKATLTRGLIKQTVAVKTLKGFLQKELVQELLDECSKMKEFDHPNVLTLRGVCLDGGPAPYIIMPFMTNGSLQGHLKENRDSLVVDPTSNADPSDWVEVQKTLLDTCIQVSKGMEYLASKRLVHRDLAARNCMIDGNFIIKIADFGLSENMDASKEYFRQNQDDTKKLPIKWMALESMSDSVFSEKTDVWAFGVTCWEVFSGGRLPYMDIHPLELLHHLKNGMRLKKPPNAACSDEIYDVMYSCWEVEPKDRPSFAELVSKFDLLLSFVAGYLPLRKTPHLDGPHEDLGQ